MDSVPEGLFVFIFQYRYVTGVCNFVVKVI